MARKSCVLIGGGEGPFVCLEGSGTLRIKGLPSGECVRLLRQIGSFVHEVLIERNGEHEVEHCDAIQLSYEGRARNFIAVLEH